ncbi:MAG: 2-amino-4-hydroxy-6-hydroxymethyldihydropteridine diphosphokinase [candidate division WOR-3 bacterium]
MIQAYISLGSNIGKRDENLQIAFNMISKLGEVKGSHIYKTEPWGREDLPEFLNACVFIRTNCSIKDLFFNLCFIEEKMGRKKKGKWEPRIIDLDLLLIKGIIFKTPKLVVPHPLLRERNFYLEPLSEIAEEEIEPISGEKIKNLLLKSPDKKKVWKTGSILQLRE